MENIPAVDKMLVIGWRATENRFLKSLSDSIPKTSIGLIVSSGEARAAQAKLTLRDAGVKCDFVASKRGFTESLLTHEIEDFLRR